MPKIIFSHDASVPNITYEKNVLVGINTIKRGQIQCQSSDLRRSQTVIKLNVAAIIEDSDTILLQSPSMIPSKKSNGIRKIPNPNPTVRCTNPAPQAHIIKRMYSTLCVGVDYKT